MNGLSDLEMSESGTKRDLVASSLDVRSQGQSRSGVEASMSRSSSNVVLRHMSCDENASLIDMTVQVGFLFFLNANFLPMNQGARSTGTGFQSFDPRPASHSSQPTAPQLWATIHPRLVREIGRPIRSICSDAEQVGRFGDSSPRVSRIELAPALPQSEFA
jgi:hypothetical protein